MSEITNVIQIKRGATVPPQGGLAPYELGFVVNNFLENREIIQNNDQSAGYLYIGDLNGINNETGELLYTPKKIKAGYADESGNAKHAKEADHAVQADHSVQSSYAEKAGNITDNVLSLNVLNFNVQGAGKWTEGRDYSRIVVPKEELGDKPSVFVPGITMYTENGTWSAGALYAKSNSTSEDFYFCYMSNEDYEKSKAENANYVTSLFRIPVSGAIDISNGGTGATTAEEARSKLGITPQNIGALPITGGYLTGTLHLVNSKYYEDSKACGIDCHNSDIIGLNGLFFNDINDSAGEGINFNRGNSSETGPWDTLYASSGKIMFHPGRTEKTAPGGHEMLHQGNMAYDTGFVATTSASKINTWTFDRNYSFYLICIMHHSNEDWSTILVPRMAEEKLYYLSASTTRKIRVRFEDKKVIIENVSPSGNEDYNVWGLG